MHPCWPLQDTSWICSLLGHHMDMCSLPFVILLPTTAGRLEGKQLSCFYPAPLLLLLDVLDAFQPVTNCPQEIFTSCFFFLLRPLEASFFMNKIWAVLLEPWREETTASAFYCCGCWCLWPHWQGEEERRKGSRHCLQCAVWSQYLGTADFVISYFKQFVTEELKRFSLNWNF